MAMTCGLLAVALGATLFRDPLAVAAANSSGVGIRGPILAKR
jgi:hypothetical protein